MTILVSRSWPTEQPGYWREGDHPHSRGRGTGNYYTFADEEWQAAQEEFASLQAVSGQVAPGMEVRYEWRRGYPSGYALLEGAFCALDDKPEEILPDFPSGRRIARRRIELVPPAQPIAVE